MESWICLRDVCKSYEAGGRRVEALRSVGLQVQRGEFVAVVGPSGSGKSTLMNILGCLDSPDSGEYWLDGCRVDRMGQRALARLRNREIGLIFQGFHLLPGLTARENVELALEYRGMPPARRRALAASALEEVGLAERMDHRPGQLSGGQQQRVAVARAIAAQPPLLLADEPTGNLDPQSGQAVLQVLQRMHRRGHTLILITHDQSAAGLAQRRLRMDGGILAKEREDGERQDQKERMAGDRGDPGGGPGGDGVDGLAGPL